jgi:hypothetical protein
MAAYVLNGGKDASASYSASATTAFSDVASGKYYTAGIGYVVSKGLVDGFTDGTFRPDNSVTGIQAAKILLGALGYKSEYEGYTGSAWKQNVLTDAEDAGLFTGMASVDLTANLTREAAAQMIWNALSADVVKYTSTGATITTTDGTTIQTGASEAQTDNRYTSLSHKVFGADITPSALTVDANGIPTITYTLQTTPTKVVATTAATPVLTSTTAISATELYNKLGASAVLKDGTSKQITITGATAHFSIANGTTGVSAADVAVVSNTYAIGGNGIVTNIYATAVADEYVVSQIVPTFGVVTTATTKANNAHGAYTTYTVAGQSGDVYSTTVTSADVDTAVVNGTVAAGDFVTAYTMNGKLYITPATLVEGAYTGKTGGKFVIGGTSYAQSAALINGTDATTLTNGNGATVTVALDQYGYVVGTVSTDSTAFTNYVYVLSAATKNKTDSDGYNVPVLVATVITYDGELTTVVLDESSGTTSSDLLGDSSNQTYGLFEYTVNADGTYALAATGTTGTADTTVTEITKGAAKLATGFYATNSTVFYVYDSTASTVTTYTGFNAAPTMSAITTATAIPGTNTAYADVVFVIRATKQDDTTPYVYLTGDYTYDKDTSTYVQAAIVGDEETTVTLSALKAAGLYSVTGTTATAVTAGGVDVALANPSTDGIYFVTVPYLTYSDGILGTGATASATPAYLATIDASVPVYVYENGSVSTTTADQLSATTGTVIVVDVTSSAITAIYIVA